MALFDKIKKPDCSSLGKKMKEAVGSLADSGKKAVGKCADGLSATGSFVGSLGIDVANNVTNGVKIAGEGLANTAGFLQKKIQAIDIQGMFETVKMHDVLGQMHTYGNNFSESALWQKIKEVASKVGGVLIYNIMLLFTMASSKEVSLKDKTMILGALGYFILPADAIPDLIAGVGYLDDMGSIAYVLGKIQSSLTPEIEQEARRKTEKIFGKSDESWYVNPEEAARQAQDAKDDLEGAYHKAASIVKSLRK